MSDATMATVLAPYVQAPEDARPLHLPDGSIVRTVASSAQTGGEVGVIEVTYAPGQGFPMHVHHQESEAHYVLEGKLLFVCGDTRVEAGPGTFMFGPCGVPHGIRALGDVPTRFLEFFLPAGLEELFSTPAQLMADVQAGRTGPPYDLDIVGPIPE
jgi:mannose-6-phosphate isomerase-like protein (cupin superfamily)